MTSLFSDINPVTNLLLQVSNFLMEFIYFSHGLLLLPVLDQTREDQIFQANLQLLFYHEFDLQITTLSDVMSVTVDTRVHFEQFRSSLHCHMEADKHPHFGLGHPHLLNYPRDPTDYFDMLFPNLYPSDPFHRGHIFEHSSLAIDSKSFPLCLFLVIFSALILC